MYVATINTPGYLPDYEPPVFETAREAWEYLRAEREHAEDYYGETEGPYSETHDELAKRARWAGSGLVGDFEAVGTVYGPTPGYDGDHDLGLAYSVTEVAMRPATDAELQAWLNGYLSGAVETEHGLMVPSEEN